MLKHGKSWPVFTIFFMVSLLLTSSSLPFVDASSESGIFEQSNSIIDAQNNFDSTQSYLHAKPINPGSDKDGDGIKKSAF